MNRRGFLTAFLAVPAMPFAAKAAGEDGHGLSAIDANLGVIEVGRGFPLNLDDYTFTGGVTGPFRVITLNSYVETRRQPPSGDPYPSPALGLPV